MSNLDLFLLMDDGRPVPKAPRIGEIRTRVALPPSRLPGAGAAGEVRRYPGGLGHPWSAPGPPARQRSWLEPCFINYLYFVTDRAEP